MDVLKLDKLTKTFGGLTAVDDVSFTIKKNEIFGLIGPNGAGKTTAFNLITGVYKVTSGEIEFLGEKIQDKPPFEIAQKGITRTFQNIRLFKKLSVFDNIFTACHLSAKYTLPEAIFYGALPNVLSKNSRYAKEERELREYTDELLNIMGLYDRKDIQANNLPYGLQRRLEIARALAVKPQLLLLDEPAAGMNPEETNQLMNLIDEIRTKFNLTVLLIEHHMDLVMGVCDNIAVLNFGAKIAEGTAAQIQNNPKVKEAYLGEEDDELLEEIERAFEEAEIKADDKVEDEDQVEAEIDAEDEHEAEIEAEDQVVITVETKENKEESAENAENIEPKIGENPEVHLEGAAETELGKEELQVEPEALMNEKEEPDA